MPRCMECDREVEAGVIFCPACGGEVPAPRPAAAETEQSGTREDDEGLVSPDADGARAGGTGAGGAGAAADAAGPDDVDAVADDDGESDERSLVTDVEGPVPFDRGPLSFAFTYPTGAGYESVLVGGVAELFGALIPVFQLPIRGYGFRLAGAAARGQSEPPAFEDLGDLLADGLRALLVTLTYVLAVGLVAGALYVFGRGVVGGAWLQLAAVAALLGAFALPASLTAYAANGSFAAAFSAEHAGAFLASGPYAKGMLLWLVALVGLGLAALTSFFTFVGGFFVVAWGWYVSASLWGYYYRQAVAREVVPTPPDEVVA